MLTEQLHQGFGFLRFADAESRFPLFTRMIWIRTMIQQGTNHKLILESGGSQQLIR